MFILLSRDNYPAVMLPSYETSPFYLLYFIPFLLIDIFLLVPIPVAVMFEAFRVISIVLLSKFRRVTEENWL
jgi:hypothetical protein